MAILKKKSYLNLNRYLPVFKKIDFEALLNDIDTRIAALQEGILPAGSVSYSELEAAVQASLTLADSALQSGDEVIQAGVANDIADATACGNLADLAAAEAAIDVLKDKINAMLAEMRSLDLLNA